MRVVLPFKDQSSANYVKQQLNNLSSKLNVTVQPVFVSNNLSDTKFKSPLLSTNKVLSMNLNITCVMQGTWVTRGHLHERVEGHTRQSSSIYKQYNLQHTIIVKYLNASSSNITSSRNVAANLIASLKK